MHENPFASGWTLALLLLGAGCGLSQSTALPLCQDGDTLGTDERGAFRCVKVSPTSLSVPLPSLGCAESSGLGNDSRFTQLYCVDPAQEIAGQPSGAELRRRIDTLAQRVETLKKSVAALDPKPADLDSVYVGSTSVPTTGSISAPGGKRGLIAAAALCSAEFGVGAHMCTPFQLTRSVAQGKLGVLDRIRPAWVYMPTWHNPQGSTTEPLAGLADNCGGYSTGTDAVGWTGMTVEWGPLASGDVAFRWHGGTDARCSSILPIACCGGGLP